MPCVGACFGALINNLVGKQTNTARGTGSAVTKGTVQDVPSWEKKTFGRPVPGFEQKGCTPTAGGGSTGGMPLFGALWHFLALFGTLKGPVLLVVGRQNGPYPPAVGGQLTSNRRQLPCNHRLFLKRKTHCPSGASWDGGNDRDHAGITSAAVPSRLKGLYRGPNGCVCATWQPRRRNAAPELTQTGTATGGCTGGADIRGHNPPRPHPWTPKRRKRRE